MSLPLVIGLLNLLVQTFALVVALFSLLVGRDASVTPLPWWPFWSRLGS